MIFQFDSCRKGKICVICISGKLLMWGNATMLIIWLAEEAEKEDAEQKVKDAVPLIMAKQ